MLGQSINRPAWVQDDLEAYKHKRISRKNRAIVLKGYYEKSKGYN